MKYFGAHVSIAGGLFQAADRAKELSATGFAMFTKNQRQWRAPAITDAEAETFQTHLANAQIPPEGVLPHDSYLINLGNPDPEKRKNATEAFVAELQRVEKLGLKYLNFHPGSGLGADLQDTLKVIAECIRQALTETSTVIPVIENTAGQGNCAGKNLEELQRLLELVNSDRCGICIDTCHAYAAGIDLASSEGYEAFWDEFVRRIELKRLRGMHLNDTKSALGSHLDRHAPLGEGNLGWTLFDRLAKDSRLDGFPMVVETPEPEKWPAEIARLRSIAK
ncbi:MAG: deoxyribonuclease IV [Kiritimatiellae bacterium]|nr:deoxyribonuclease IV [Kiritimatiellia bacterium]